MIPYEDLSRVNRPFLDAFGSQFRAITERGWFILGQEVEAFEAAFATYCQADYCIGAGSGLDALTLALNALDLPKGSQVIVPAHTFIATIFSVIHSDLTPVLVEPELASYNLDPEKVEAAITPKTKAIVAVHLYGKIAQMDKLAAVARRHNLFLLEDASQAHGATFKGQKAGSFGDLAAFSFYPTKNLGALGDGGAVTTRSLKFARRVRQLRNYGSTKKYYNQKIGFNSRLDELQAAFLRTKLQHLDKINQHKKQLADLYFQHVKGEFTLPIQEEGFENVFHIFPVRHPDRNRLKTYLREQGIQTEIHYPVPPHQQEALKHFFAGQHLPITEKIHRTELSLPISFGHTKSEIMQVIEVLNDFE